MCSCQRTNRLELPKEFTPDRLVRKNCVQKVVGVTGFEPVTLRLSSACSNQLSYTPVMVGGAEESRTPDL